MPETYRIVRHFQRSGAKRTILRGLTLALAQLHCNDPQTCSDTCTTAVGRRRTSRSGRWFDGFAAEQRPRPRNQCWVCGAARCHCQYEA
jgi:hypothetical protein